MPSPGLALPLLSLLALSAPPQGGGAEPWGDSPLSGDPKAILAAARALTPPKGVPVDVLLEEGDFVFDERGAATFTYRLVYRPLSRDAARSWARIERNWAPWHQSRPEIRARVITPSGGVHLLDPRTLVESGVGESGDELYSDRRVLQGPLPAVVADAIVEEVSVVRDEAPFFDAGSLSRFWFAQPNPVRRVRLRLDSPKSLPIRWAARGADLRPTETQRDGRRVLLFERRDSAARGEIEPFPPRDADLAPQVVFTTGRSWEEVARRYAEVLETRLRGSDLSATVKRVVPEGTSRPVAVRLLTTWLHQNVRYTGLEFGEAAIVPAPPDETLGRRYGDCKDLSLLLVGLLRAAGIEAHVALLRTQWFEVSPDLPGLGEFDHAIVRVDGKEPIWIDPTDPYTAPGRLAPPDEGRLALVARAGTKALVATPTSRSVENHSRTVREVFLAELGRGRVVETRELSGALASGYRAARARATEEGQREALQRYATEVFKAERFVSGEVKGGDDVATPVDIRVEVDGSDVAQTDDDEAIFPVTPDPIFSNLPDFVRGEGGREGEAAGDGKPAPRTRELQLAEPYAAEMIYRIRPPLGFRPRPVPRDASWSFGEARYEARYAVDGDGSITATFRFDTGNRRLSPKEADGLVREVRAIIRDRSPLVTFERLGAALLAQGRVAEALAEMERLAALHPKEATHRLHLAIADFQLGFPAEGLAEARRAIELEPERAWGWRVLGLGLQHDEVGRFRAPGFDRAGAIAAFRKARELDPRHAGGRAGLAGLLATSADGRAPPPAADVEQALAEWRSVREELDDHHYDAEYARALIGAGRYADAAEVARSLEKGEGRDALLVAAAAAAEGPSAAEAEARRLPPDAARAALQRAAGQLVQVRRYADAGALASLAARGAPNAAELQAQADLLSSARRWEELVAQGDEPTRLVRRLFAALVVERDPVAAVEKLMASRGRKRGDPASPSPVGDLRSAIVRSAGRLGAPPAAVLDIALGRLEVIRDGEGPGLLRLRVRLPFAPGGRGSSIYLVKEKGGWKLLATDEALPEVGVEALRLADAGELAGARKLLDWALSDLDGGTPGGPGPQDVIAALWTRNGPPPAPAIRLAAAALAAWGERPEPGIPVLERALATPGDATTRRAVQWALTVAYRHTERFEDLARTAGAILDSEPGSRPALTRKVMALERLGRRDEVERLVAGALDATPDDPYALSLLASTRLALGDLDGAGKAYRRLIDGGKATPGDFNNAAWLMLWTEPVGDTAVDWARRAVEGTGRRQYASLNTLAAVLAAAGRPAEAREVFLQALDVKETNGLDGADWVVQGLIAEKYGLAQAARAAFSNVKDGPDDDPRDPTRSSAYARMRLAKLPAPR
jgi:tetratricopeptide (TPR) repeat protein/transglutaminase-like putative cysteine protease